MTDHLRCAFFHAFDGKCCDTERECLCAITPPKLSVPTHDISHRRPYWLMVLAVNAVLWVGIFALAWLAFGGPAP